MSVKQYVCPEYQHNGGVAPIYVMGVCELKAEQIILEVSIKHGSVGAISDITDDEKTLIENSASRGYNYGFFWKDRLVIESPEMKEIFEVSEPFDKEFDRLRKNTQRWSCSNVTAYELLHVQKEPEFCHYVDVRRAVSLFDRRYSELKDLANPWFKYITRKHKI